MGAHLPAHTNAATAIPLAFIERRIGAFEYSVHVTGCFGRKCQANTQADAVIRSPDVERLGHQANDAVCQLHRL